LLPRIAIAAGVTEGTAIELRPLAGAGAWRTLGLAWRPNAPRASEYRALVPLLTDTCRDALTSPGPAVGAK
jgi:LysR family transcriptional regulator, hydrogen peroxide-inducible genes activator